MSPHPGTPGLRASREEIAKAEQWADDRRCRDLKVRNVVPGYPIKIACGKCDLCSERGRREIAARAVMDCLGNHGGNWMITATLSPEGLKEVREEILKNREDKEYKARKALKCTQMDASDMFLDIRNNPSETDYVREVSNISGDPSPKIKSLLRKVQKIDRYGEQIHVSEFEPITTRWLKRLREVYARKFPYVPAIRFFAVIEVGNNPLDGETFRPHVHLVPTTQMYLGTLQSFQDQRKLWEDVWSYGSVRFDPAKRSIVGPANYAAKYLAKEDREKNLGDLKYEFFGGHSFSSRMPGLGLPMIRRIAQIHGQAQADKLSRLGVYFDDTDNSWYQSQGAETLCLGPNAQTEDLLSGLRYRKDGRVWSFPMDERARAEFEVGYRIAAGIWQRAPSRRACEVYDKLPSVEKHPADAYVRFLPERDFLFKSLRDYEITPGQYTRMLLNMRGVPGPEQKGTIQDVPF